MSPPNIIWITLDSVRADHTSIGGYRRDTTPEISRFGSEGEIFEHCFAHGKATLPSSGAILTGQAPTRSTLGISGHVLPDSIDTIAERFGRIGYTTACLSRNSFISAETGLDRGFDRFQWVASETMRDLAPQTLFKYLVNIRNHSAGLTTDSAKHSSPYLMNETGKRWLGKLQEKQPFFFYLHYNEPHRPYYPPLPFIDRYTDEIEMGPREAAEFALKVHYNLKEIIASGCKLDDHEWEALLAMYDAEIAYTDEMIGRFVDYIKSLSLGDTIIVITADHGELFGEYGLLSHRYVLNDAVTHVPLVVIDVDDDFVVDYDGIVQHADIMTTLLGKAGGRTGDTIGIDLREETREYAVSQRGPIDFDDLYEFNEDFDTSPFHLPTLTALRTDQYRFQRSAAGSELFSLPDEQTDVSSEHPDIATDLSTKLDTWLEKYGSPIDEGREDTFSEAVQRQLRDLGYID